MSQNKSTMTKYEKKKYRDLKMSFAQLYLLVTHLLKARSDDYWLFFASNHYYIYFFNNLFLTKRLF